MVTQPSMTRLFVAGGFAAAVLAAPAAAAILSFAGPVATTAACPAGESEDLYSTVCVPDLVPNSPGGTTPFSSIPGNPDLPAIDGIPCTGANSGQCIGLAEEQQAPVVQPRTSVSSSP
ncbi:hypothetical protein SAMN04489835_2146 [Mycolicibacterium rutilum]|uniref:Intersectin-EH binding protein Ibp1 n=1 Tax=Mycolicibacterium rutilum TaxID=370526 RepID=A0A1H6JP45_MYCRU|nr:intersectin-EH binding protein Ibp1 [Mycolicibacterium rutilum]SEH62335.1 hypothetical protein SAMN04489835_2146 [Mycolicibacterium rutilum]